MLTLLSHRLPVPRLDRVAILCAKLSNADRLLTLIFSGYMIAFLFTAIVLQATWLVPILLEKHDP
jgi:hypothetical protein